MESRIRQGLTLKEGSYKAVGYAICRMTDVITESTLAEKNADSEWATQCELGTQTILNMYGTWG